MLLALPALEAQVRRVEGSVAVVIGADTLAVSGARVVLHGVGRQAQGPLDSTRAGPDGGFRFAFASQAQTVYILSARHAGIEYFSEPIGTTSPGPARVRIVVSDTSSGAPVGLAARYFLVGVTDAASERSVIDVLVLENASGRTRVSADSSRPTWAMSGLPDATTAVEDGTEFSVGAVRVRNDSVLVFAPIPPGRRQVVLSHTLAVGAASLRVPIPVEVPELSVLGEEPGLRVEGPGIAAMPAGQLEGQAIMQWSGRVDAGGSLTLRFARPDRPGPGTLAGLVALIAAGFSVAAWRALRRPPAPAPASPTGSVPSPDGAAALLDALARLDARHKDHPGRMTATEWSDYQAERARLKARLASALARRGPAA